MAGKSEKGKISRCNVIIWMLVMMMMMIMIMIMIMMVVRMLILMMMMMMMMTAESSPNLASLGLRATHL